MQTTRYAEILARGQNKQLLTFFKYWYQRQQMELSHRDAVTTVRIPKIMHHVWFGKPLCNEFKQLRQTWLDCHQHWIAILWTDRPENDVDAVVVHSFEELTALLQSGSAQRIVVLCDALVFDNRVHFDNASNYGERSDILKWEIVYRYGGVYIDTDFECYQSLEPLHYAFDFYTGLQPLDTGMVQLGAALYAAYPYHPLLERCVKDITPGQGPIVVRTGPIHFTHVCLRNLANIPGRNIVLPSDYFYPCGYEERLGDPSRWRKPISYAVHHWAGSWLTQDAFIQP
jgi:mannosyltransferase OCH1-like enzyme